MPACVFFSVCRNVLARSRVPLCVSVFESTYEELGSRHPFLFILSAVAVQAAPSITCSYQNLVQKLSIAISIYGSSHPSFVPTMRFCIGCAGVFSCNLSPVCGSPWYLP